MIKLLGVLVMGMIMFSIAPLFTIAALNALFSLGIEYTFINWISILWLQLVVAVKLKR